MTPVWKSLLKRLKSLTGATSPARSHVRRPFGRTILRAERLEDRWVPAFMLRLEQAGFAPLTISDNGSGDTDPSAGTLTSSAAYGTFYFSFTTVLTKPGIPPVGSPNGAELDINQFSITSTGGGTLLVTAGDTDYADPTAGSNPLTLTTAIGGTLTSEPGSTVTFQSWANSNNLTPLTDPATTIPAASATPGPVGPFGTGPYNATQATTFTRGAGSYALFAQAAITLTAGGTVGFNAFTSVRGSPLPPQMQLVKLTNGSNNDSPTGPVVLVGSTVTWTYQVTNTGSEPVANLSVDDDAGTPGNTTDDFTATPVLSAGFNLGDANQNNLLDVGEMWTFTATGTARAGQYTNLGTATGRSTVSSTPLTATNPDNHFGALGQINILKLTNGTNNDNPLLTGPLLVAGSTVTWNYNVTNPGNVPLKNVTVTDNQAGVAPVPVLSGGFNVGDTNANNLLDVTETWVFTATGVATNGQYTNIGTTTGLPVTPTGGTIPGATTVTATNPDRYYGYVPGEIGNFVWNDLNGNGVQDTGEPGINGVTLTLTGVAIDGSPVSATQTTSGNGGYLFGNLPPGTYSVSLATPAGYVPTATGKGTTATDSNPTPTGTTPGTLASGGSDLTLDFGFYQPVSVGNFVWNDLNGNGVQDTGEPGINGVTLTLTGTDGAGVAVSKTTTTDASGAYLFGNLPPGTYSVAVATPAGYVPTATGKGTTATDSNPTPTGTTPGTLASGGSDLTLDFGFYQPVSVGNFVWNDLNGNGVQDTGEPGINGVTLTLTGTDGAGVAVSKTTTTDASGAYLFGNLPPGTYSVAVATPAGYVPTATGKGTTATDSNPTPTGTSPAALASGGSDLTLDFGFYQPVSVGNFVWNDLNGNGVQDTGEPGINGVTLTLTGTDGAGVAVSKTTTTDASGAYLFGNLPPGTYSVAVATPAGYVPTATGKGTTATDSNPTPTGTSPAALASGGSDLTLDFGFYQPVSVGNFVWNDLNGNGVQDTGEPGINGVTLTLTGTDGAGVAVSKTTTTDASGAYLFGNLPPGTYSVAVATPAGYVPTATGKGTTATDSNPTPTGTSPAALASGGSDLTLDFGFYQPVSVGNFVWNDLNGNGVQDTGEPGINGVTLTLTGTTGAGASVTLTTTTTGNGGYLFSNLAPGTYSVSVDSSNFTSSGALVGYTASPTLVGTNRSVDSNVSPSGTTPAALPGGTSDLTVDFGYYKITDLSITKTDGTTTYTPGGSTTYTIVVTNNGPSAVTGAPVVDNFPAAITSATWTAVASAGGSVAKTSGTGNISTTVNLPVGGTATFTVVAQISATAGSAASTADFSTLNGGVEASLGVQNATLGNVRADAFYLNGSTFVSAGTALTVRNAPSDHGLGILSPGETFSQGGDYNEVSALVNAEVLRLTKAAGDTWTSLWVSSLDSGGSGGAETGTLYWSNSATPNLSTLATKFVFKYGDFGGSEEGNVLALAAASGFDPSAGYVFFIAGPNAAGNNNDYLVWKATTATPGNLVNTATVSAPPGVTDTNPSNNTATDTDTPGVTNVDLAVTKTDNTPTYVPGTSTTYVMVVSNNGPAAVANATVLDVFPAAITGATWTAVASAGASVAATSGTGNISTAVSLNPGATVTFTVVAQIALSATGNLVNTVTVSAPPGVTDTNPSNNTATDTDTNGALPKIDIEKTTNGPSNANPVAPDYDNEDLATGAGVPLLTPGTAVTWTYKVTNTGNLAFTTAQVSVTDDNGTPANTADDLTTANGKITLVPGQAAAADGLLSPGETWLYTATGIVQTLVTAGSAVTVGFSGNSALSGAFGNVRTFNAGGVMVNASGFSRDKSNGAWAPAYLGSYGGGLGVTDSSEGDGSNDMHTVDNVGRDNYVLFEFSQNVIVDSAFLGYVVNDSDLTYWIGTLPNAFTNHQTLSDAVLNSLGFTEVNLTDLTTTRTADLNAGKVAGNVLVIAAWTGDTTPEDRFKIQNVTFQPALPGVYENKGTVTVPGATDSDLSHYKNPTASLGDRLFNDLNGNGTQDTGEPGVAGVTVTLVGGGADGLINGVGDTTAATMTNSSGLYSFTGLTPGVQYQVQFSNLPAGFLFTQANVNNNSQDTVDSDANPLTGKTQVVTLTAGQNNTTLDAGIYNPQVTCPLGPIGGVNLGNLTKYLFVFTDGSTDANWQGATKGFAGDVVVDGKQASERTSGGVPYAGTIYTNDSTLGAWQSIVNQNPGQASAVTGQTALVSGVETDLANAFTQINGLTATPGYTSVSASSLNGLNTQDGIGKTYVINITSGFSISSKICITGDASDVFVLRWDTDANFSNGYQGQVKFQSGGAIVPLGGLTVSNFISVAGDIASSGGGTNPSAPYPQGPIDEGTGNLISGGSNFSGGGFFTGYWLTTGDANGKTSSLSNAIFAGGWYTTSKQFSLTSGTSGVHVCPTTPSMRSGLTMLTNESALATTTGTLGTVASGVYLVAVDGLQGNLGAAMGTRIQSAITALNASLTPWGATLVVADASNREYANTFIHIADSTLIGGVDQGVLGVTLDNEITLVGGWNWYTGADAGSVPADQYDFQTVVTHELGHAVGLGHSGDAASVMYPYLGTGRARRVLTAADLAVIEVNAENAPEPLLAAPRTAAAPAAGAPSVQVGATSSIGIGARLVALDTPPAATDVADAQAFSPRSILTPAPFAALFLAPTSTQVVVEPILAVLSVRVGVNSSTGLAAFNTAGAWDPMGADTLTAAGDLKVAAEAPGEPFADPLMGIWLGL